LRAARLVAGRQAAAPARERAVVDQQLAPVLRVVVDARLDPVEPWRERGQSDGPLDRSDGGRQIAEPLLREREHALALHALVGLHQLAKDRGGGGSAAFGEREPRLGRPRGRLAGKGIGQILEAGTRVGELAPVDLDLDQLLPEGRQGGTLVQPAPQVDDGV
jgi:hypothetical protein